MYDTRSAEMLTIRRYSKDTLLAVAIIRTLRYSSHPIRWIRPHDSTAAETPRTPRHRHRRQRDRQLGFHVNRMFGAILETSFLIFPPPSSSCMPLNSRRVFSTAQFIRIFVIVNLTTYITVNAYLNHSNSNAQPLEHDGGQKGRREHQESSGQRPQG